jgi:hypothetical protein
LDSPPWTEVSQSAKSIALKPKRIILLVTAMISPG